MKNYPLVFTFRDFIAGNGFIAHVVMEGYVLLVEEDDGDSWMHGVRPGCMAGGGSNRDAAFQAFKDVYLTVLYDVASEAPDFTAFQEEVAGLLNQVNVPFEKDWKAARTQVRRGNLEIEALPRVNTKKKNPRLDIQLVKTQRTKPSKNKLASLGQAA